MCAKSSTFAVEMKNKWLNSMAVVLAVCFVWAGSGVNYVRYCCDACRQAGIAHILNHSCERVHHPADYAFGQAVQHEHGTDCCHHGDGCAFVRLKVSQGGISHAVHVPEAMVLDVLALPVAAEETVLPATVQEAGSICENTGGTIPITGRTVSIRNRAIII